MAKDDGKKMNPQTNGHQTEKYEALPLSAILVSLAFNVRHANHLQPQSGTNDGETTDIGVLSHSIESEGQDSPVVVRPNPDPKSAEKFPFSLVSGFRRYAAIEMLASRALSKKEERPIKAEPTWSASTPTIKAFVRNMTETEAQLLNMRENTARNNLGGADLAFGVHRLVQAYAREKGGNTRGGPRLIAAALGKDESYVGKLLTIMQTLDAKITDHWRSAAKPAPVMALFDLCDEKKFRPEEREEKYNAICGGSEGKKPSGEKETKDPIETMKDGLMKSSNFLGRLHEQGHINCDDTAWMSRGLLRELGTVNNKIVGEDEKIWKALAHAAKAGFEQGRKDVRDEADKAATKAAAKAAGAAEKAAAKAGGGDAAPDSTKGGEATAN